MERVAHRRLDRPPQPRGRPGAQIAGLEVDAGGPVREFTQGVAAAQEPDPGPDVELLIGDLERVKVPAVDPSGALEHVVPLGANPYASALLLGESHTKATATRISQNGGSSGIMRARREKDMSGPRRAGGAYPD